MSGSFFSRPVGKFWTATLPITGCLRPCELAGTMSSYNPMPMPGICYAERCAARYGTQSLEQFHRVNYVNAPGVRKLIAARKTRIVFGSMTEPAGWDGNTWSRFQNLVALSRHQFLLCTKQPAPTYGMLTSSNLWPGFTATNQVEYDERVNLMPELNRWCILEPLRGPIDLHLGSAKLSWVVVGLETGRRIPVEKWWPEAFDSLRDQCEVAHVPLWEKALPIKTAAFRQMPDALAAIWEHNA